jgi:hypothetical protein
MTRLLPALLLLSSCLPEFPKRDFVADPTADHDGDGFTELDGDCDDAEALAYPGADEVCDGIDNDCDGDADEDDAIDAPVWYFDADRDGFGTESFTVNACAAPSENYVPADPAGFDCDDGNPGVHPAAQEVCSGKDDDCDTFIDHDDDSMVGLKVWYINQDGDGFGVDAEDTNVEACDGPDGYAYNSGDCDDTDPLVNPTAVEQCDGIDNNCNDLIDDEDPEMAGDATWYADTDNDGFGDPVGESKEQCAQPVGFVLDSTDCDDTRDTTNIEATETCNERDDDCDGVVDDGVLLDFFADADGDGHGDLAAPIEACSLPEGFVLSFDDCDDSNPAVNPYTDELCATEGVDDNCDGRVDESDAADATTWYRDADADGFGDADTTLVQCAEPFSYVAEAGDCDDSRATSHPGAVELCGTPTRDDDCDGDLNDDGAEGCTEYWYDGDGDGYGDASLSQCLCLADEESGYDTLRSDDCDDTQEAVHPERAEDCSTLVDDNCSGGFNDEDGLGCTLFWVDTDVDGFGEDGTMQCLCVAEGARTAEAGGDCDDLEFSINPGVDEVCTDEIDNDCDGLTNDATAVDAVVWYRDDDGDGYGVETLTETACEEPDGYTDTTGDCDDSRDGINPGATENCVTVWDDDCSGSFNDLDAEACTEFYADHDGDGYGLSDDLECRCEADVSTVYTSRILEDCDDTDPGISPGDVEVCDDADVDEDCDGIADPQDTVGCTTYFYDYDGDGFGINESQCLCESSGYYDAITLGDCDDTDSSISPAEDNCGLNGLVTHDQAAAVFPSGNVAVGDYNRDTILDVMIGMPDVDGLYTGSGLVALWFGPLSGEYTLDGDKGPDLIFRDDHRLSAQVGSQVAMTDIDADGFDELLISTSSVGYGSENAYIIDDGLDGLGPIGVEHEGVTTVPYMHLMALGDTDDDGFNDVALCLSGGTSLWSRPVPVTCQFASGTADGLVSPEEYVPAHLNYILEVDRVDLNADGVMDYATGVRTVGFFSIWDGAESHVTGEGSFHGVSLGASSTHRTVGDLDGDGYADYAHGDYDVGISDPFSGAFLSTGKVEVLVGGADLTEAGGELGLTIYGNSERQRLGRTTFMADYNNDGHVDLIVTKPQQDIDGLGGVLFYGPFTLVGDTRELDDGDAFFDSPGLLHTMGAQDPSLTDINGDGFDDIWQSNSENTFLFLGSP